MLLYHGTSLEKARKIIEDGVLKADIERLYKSDVIKDANTTNGLVYLTSQLYTAYYYGNIANRSDDRNLKYVVIFRTEVDETKLLPDYDEIKVITDKNMHEEHISADISLALCGAVTIAEDLDIRNAEYMLLPCTMNFIEDEEDVHICRELSKTQLHNNEIPISETYEKVNKRFSWKKVSEFN